MPGRFFLGGRLVFFFGWGGGLAGAFLVVLVFVAVVTDVGLTT